MMDFDSMGKCLHVLEEVKTERVRQEDKWGEQNHSLAVYFVILAEEVGEAAKAICGYTFGRDEGNIRTELIHVAAVAVAMIECIDRNRLRGR